MFSPPPDEAEALARDPIDPVEATETSWKTPPKRTSWPSRRDPGHPPRTPDLRRLARAHRRQARGLARRLRVVLRRPARSPRQLPNYEVRVASSRATQTAWRMPRRPDRRPNFRAGRVRRARRGRVVLSEACRASPSPRLVPALVGPTAPEAVDVLCEVGQVVLRVAAGGGAHLRER